jgi:hypothetical protein
MNFRNGVLRLVSLVELHTRRDLATPSWLTCALPETQDDAYKTGGSQISRGGRGGHGVFARRYAHGLRPLAVVRESVRRWRACSGQVPRSGSSGAATPRRRCRHGLRAW